MSISRNEYRHTSLHSHWSNSSLIILIFNQLRPLDLPKSILVLFRKIAKEVEEVGDELSLIGIIDPVFVLALVRLVRVVDGEIHIADLGDSADFAFSLIEDLNHVGDNEVEPVLPFLGLLVVLLLVGLLEGVDPGIDSPP